VGASIVQVSVRYRNNIIIKAYIKQSLYFLPVKPENNTINITINILYKRFTYINKKNLKNLIKNTTSKYIYKNNLDCSNCKIYIQAKLLNQRNKQFKNNKIQYNYLEKISSDLCGLFKIKIYDNKVYFIIFFNKNSRYLKVQLLANKTEIYSVFLEFKATTKNNLKGYKIKVFQYNNGTKYKTLYKYLRKEGIIIQLSPLYIPKSNKLPKRINRTIITKVRAMLIKSNAPKYL